MTCSKKKKHIPALNQGIGYKHVPDLSSGISNPQLNAILAGTANLQPSRYPNPVNAVDIATAEDTAWLRLARLHANSDVRDTRGFLLAMLSVVCPIGGDHRSSFELTFRMKGIYQVEELCRFKITNRRLD